RCGSARPWTRSSARLPGPELCRSFERPYAVFIITAPTQHVKSAISLQSALAQAIRTPTRSDTILINAKRGFRISDLGCIVPRRNLSRRSLLAAAGAAPLARGDD